MRIEAFAFITLVIAGLITLFTDGDPLHFREVLPFCRGVPPTAYDLGVTVILLFFMARLLCIARGWWAGERRATPSRTSGLPEMWQSTPWQRIQDDSENNTVVPVSGPAVPPQGPEDSRICRSFEELWS